MASLPDELEAAALGLPRAERARLVKALIDSLDDDLEVDAAWADEVRRRLDAHRAGTLQTVDADDVLRSLRERRGR